MRDILKKSACLFIAMVLATSVSGCGETKTTDKLEKSGKLVVGTSADYAPYEYRTMVNGKSTIIGIDISIAEEIAKDLGVRLQIEDMRYDKLLSALNSGSVDIVIAGMSPGQERKKTADFSKVYYKPQNVVMVRSGDKGIIKGVSDLSGKKIGAQSGTVQEKIAKMQIKDAVLTTSGKISDLVSKLKNKKIDALVVELPVARGYTRTNTDLVLSDVTVDEYTEGAAIAVKKNNQDFVNIINKSLDRLTSEGDIEKFVQQANDKNTTK
jgi:polar amino acid transport system substrate-binding protein